jgi:acid-sensing ion channel, other
MQSRLTVTFKESQIQISKREEQLGQSEFIANCGGLLGLFMGVSLMSFVELIYFCTVRLLVDMGRKMNFQNF